LVLSGKAKYWKAGAIFLFSDPGYLLTFEFNSITMAKPKFYVVWKGRTPGIYDNWETCNTQIQGFPGAEFKSFKTRAMAEEAYRSSSEKYIGQDVFETELTPEQLVLLGDPRTGSISVDAAWNTLTGDVEYQGVETESKKVLFHQGPFADGTINIAEFLAIVHALAHCRRQGLTCPIYSDSRNAIGWVKDKEVRTNHPRRETNKNLFELVDRALDWLKTHNYSNELLKWETRAWGENPADFGRK
jgi:ribonuclease HI